MEWEQSASHSLTPHLHLHHVAPEIGEPASWNPPRFRVFIYPLFPRLSEADPKYYYYVSFISN